MPLEHVLGLVKLVEEIEKTEQKQEQPKPNKSQVPRPETVIRENFTVYGTEELYSTHGQGKVVELSLVTSSEGYELFTEIDGYRNGGSFNYWRSISSYSTTVDAFQASDGYYVLRLQEIPFSKSFRVAITVQEPLQVKTLIVKVVPFEHGGDT